MTTFGLLLGIGGLTGGWAALEFLRTRAARTWPSVPARVVEVPSQSHLERFGPGEWILNTDTDHVLVWTVGGQEFNKRVDDRAVIQVAGFKLWRRPPKLETVIIHYDPRAPGTGLTPEEIGAWRWLLLVSAVFVLFAACVRLL